MLDMLLEICLADRPDTCLSRLVPAAGACSQAGAADWADAHDATLVAFECRAAAQAVTPLEVAEIAPGVFVHRGHHALTDAGNRGDIANLGFVIGPEAVAVIDAGGSRAVGEALFAAIRARTDLPIRWLVLTHMHPDHVFGASVFSEAGARIVGHANLAAALGARADSYRAGLAREAGPEVAFASEIVAPDFSVGTRHRIDLGGRVLEIAAHPTAHTDNDLTVLDTATGTLFLGDLVFVEHLPVIDGSALGWLGVLDELARRPAARAVPGHGPASIAWPEGSRPTRDYLAALVAETRTAIAQGARLSEAAPRLGAGLRDGWLLFDTFNPRNATAVYRELEWE